MDFDAAPNQKTRQPEPVAPGFAGPSLTIAVRRDRAGVRKPPRKETASRKDVAAAATYGDLRALASVVERSE
jgi:hypothetical protein